MKKRLNQLGWNLIDIFFPPRCVGCGQWGEYWCEDCLQNVETISAPFCEICGDPQSRLNHQMRCQRCDQHQPEFQSLRSWAVFGGAVQEAVHQLKYRKNIALGRKLADLMKDVLGWNSMDIDLIVPVPLGRERRKTRGYNQAMLIARPLAQKTGIPLSGTALKRIRETQSQVGLSISERRKNVTGAFAADSGQVSNRSILVVDDVTTTGSTINACAAALNRQGAAGVHGLTIARALRGSHAA